MLGRSLLIRDVSTVSSCCRKRQFLKIVCMELRAEPFRFESQMFAPFVAAIPNIFSSKLGGDRLRILRETTVGGVIPDLLIGSWRGNIPYAVSLSNVARHILALLLEHPVAFPPDVLEMQLFLTPDGADRAVSQLRRARAVQVRESGEIDLTPTFRMSTTKLVAVEMKLKRWREAFEQATRYLSFADEAYVVLDGSQANVDDFLVREFELSPLGLILQRGSAFERVIEPTPIPVRPSADRLLALQKLAAAEPHCFVWANHASNTSNHTF